MSVENPFPFEGTVTPTDYGYSANLPVVSEYLTESDEVTVL